MPTSQSFVSHPKAQQMTRAADLAYMTLTQLGITDGTFEDLPRIADQITAKITTPWRTDPALLKAGICDGERLGYTKVENDRFKVVTDF